MEGMFEIGEMARLFDISRQTLIYYDRIGLFHPARVNDHGYRFYAPTQIPMLRLICMLRELGVELKEIERLMGGRDIDAIVGRLFERVGSLEAQIAGLARQRDSVMERLTFYREVGEWRDREGVPTLRHYPCRRVVVEPFGATWPTRPVLHATLMRAAHRMREVSGMGPVRGWGSMLCADQMRGDEPLAGAGAFVTVPAGVDASGVEGLTVLPEGTYLCLARWGMPYDPAGIRRLAEALEEHRLRAVGDAFDFCLLDATSYTDEHAEDFCCLQIPVELAL